MPTALSAAPPKPAGSCSLVAWTLFLVCLFCVGVALLGVGVVKLDSCPSEPALPVWMTAAGATLVLMAAVCGVYAVCSCCKCCTGMK